jgi:hypothetical protein
MRVNNIWADVKQKADGVYWLNEICFRFRSAASVASPDPISTEVGSIGVSGDLPEFSVA